MDLAKSGVPSSVKFFADLSQLVVDALAAAKARSLMKALRLLPEIQQVIQDAKLSLPELEHLSADDALKVGEAAYACVKKIVQAA